MTGRRTRKLGYGVAELDGVRYALLREGTLLGLCRKAGVDPMATIPGGTVSEMALRDVDLDRDRLAKRLALRRKRAGLTQVELARRAGIRVETLNRVERSKTTPDFSTVRKIVVAIDEVEANAEIEPSLE